MKALWLLAGVAGTLAFASPARAEDTCTRLQRLHSAGMTITRAEMTASPAQVDPKLIAAGKGSPFCRVAGYLTPTKDSRIGFEVWLPAAARWNQRLQAVGNGGLLGGLNFKAMMPGVQRGYATMTTDLGHTNTPAGASEDASWVPGHPDRVVDYAYRGEHLSALAAKKIATAFYGRAPRHAFYTGCSAGGIQGLSELLRFPHDFDGYVVGAATPDHVGQEIGAMWNTLAASLASPRDALLPGQAAALHAMVLRDCAGHTGGAPGDAFLTTPTACRIDPRRLSCQPGQDANSCLSPAQVAIVDKIYGGPVNPRTGEQLFSGLTPGTELGWQRYFLGKKNPIGMDRPWAGFMALMAYDDPAYLTDQRYLSFDFDKDLAWVRTRIVGGETLDSSWNVRNRNIDAFRAAGGKVIQYHGWDDPNIPALEAVRFRGELLTDLMSRRHLTRDQAEAQLATYYNLFMLPGVGHCSGGPGPDEFGQSGRPAGDGPDQDALAALERWVDGAAAPTRFVASRKDEKSGLVTMTRPICAWPKAAVWDGKGDAKLASSFTCALPPQPKSQSTGSRS